jgi:hypothetical protein
MVDIHSHGAGADSIRAKCIDREESRFVREHRRGRLLGGEQFGRWMRTEQRKPFRLVAALVAGLETNVDRKRSSIGRGPNRGYLAIANRLNVGVSPESLERLQAASRFAATIRNCDGG